MDNKYNLNRNRKPLTPEDIEKGQNFDAFLKNYSAAKKPFYKTTTFYFGVAAAGVLIAVGTYFALSGTGTQPQGAFIQPPLAGLNVADTVYTVDGAQGGEFLYKTGSLIRVPEGAFVDSAGKTVSGKIELHYREFHDPGEIFFAGIPMTYDSAGQRYHFESAGMLEITAWQNGKPLKVNPSQPLQVAMASDAPEENKYNLYFLDTLKKNWNYIAKDKPRAVGFVPDTTQSAAAKAKADSLRKMMAALVPPVEPHKADKKHHSFAIKFDPAEFPELTAYKGVRFEVDEKKTPYNVNDKNVQWEDVTIARSHDDSYMVTFTKDEQKATYATIVVVDEANYAEAKKTYDARYAEYEKSLKARQAAHDQQQQGWVSRLMNADARRIFVNDSVLQRALSMRRARVNVGSDKEDMVVREFLITGFGVWNSDCPASLPAGPPMFVRVLDSRTKKPLEADKFYLVEKGRNAIFTYYSHDMAQFRFNNDAENMLWTVTADGKLATCSADDLKNIAGKNEASLVMTVQSEPLNTPEQARKAMGI